MVPCTAILSTFAAGGSKPAAVRGPARVLLRGKRPCLRRKIEFRAGSGPLGIDAGELAWASPADLTGIAALASAARDGIQLTLPTNVDVAQYLVRPNDREPWEILGKAPMSTAYEWWKLGGATAAIALAVAVAVYCASVMAK